MKILILRLSSLGDIVLTQPVCAFLRKRYPDAQIDFIVKSQYLELVSLMGCELNPIAYDKRFKAHLQLSKIKYDLVIDLHGKMSSYLLRFAAMGRVSVVYDKQRSKRKKIVSGSKSLMISSAVDLYSSALQRAFKEDVILPLPKLYGDVGLVTIDLPENIKKVVLFPGATHFTKRYPVSEWKEVLRSSPSDYFYFLCGSTSEFHLCEELHRASSSNTENFAGNLSFSSLLSLMMSADCVVSGDTGPMHIAAALGKHQIVLFGATHPRLGFAPMNPKAIVFSKDIPCQPCSLHGGTSCPQGHFRCMLTIKPYEVLDAIASILQSISTGTTDKPSNIP